MDDIQSWWEVPSIAHFCSLFRAAFNLLDFDIEELENALLTDGVEDAGNSLLQELIVKLLTGCLPKNAITTSNYQMFLRRLFRQKCKEYGQENPFDTDIDFQFLSLRTKVEILHALCDFRLDAEDVMDLLKNLDSDSLRVHPLGRDRNKSVYWYFYGTRLYREDYDKKKEAEKKTEKRGRGRKRKNSKSESVNTNEIGTGEWTVVCYSESDWERLVLSTEDSGNKEEEALHQILAKDFLPEIPRLFEEKERLQRKRLLEMMPRRQSSRIEKLKHQKEEEKKLEQKKRKEMALLEYAEEVESKKKQEEQMRKDREKKRQERQQRIQKRRGNSESSLDWRTSSEDESDKDYERVMIADDKGKPKGRQTNNSLSSATGQIIIQAEPAKQKLRTSLVFPTSFEDVKIGMYKIIEKLKNHEDAWPFSYPVESEDAPRYYSVIKEPMDLQTMEDKLDNREYSSATHFKRDFQLIVDNCRKFNGPSSEYSSMVSNLEKEFHTLVSKYLVELSSDEEVAVEFPEHHKRKRKHRSPSWNRKHHHDEYLDDKENEERSSTPAESSFVTKSVCSSVDDKGEDSPEDELDETRSADSRTRRKHHKKSSSASNRLNKVKNSNIKNAAAIEALELATEQTLKDINKWLDDTPKFSDYSSENNSPVHHLGVVDDLEIQNRIESDYRKSFQLDKPLRLHKESLKRRHLKDPQNILKKKREIQRKIDRLQPGKSKGNLLTTNKQPPDETSVAGNNSKESTKTDENDASAPKLSLGTVLTSDDIGLGSLGSKKLSFVDSPSSDCRYSDDEKNEVLEKIKETKADSDSESKQSEKLEIKPTEQVKHEENTLEEDQNEKAEVKPPAAVPEKLPIKAETACTKEKPNLSAWFKAFGAPKAAPIPKRKSDSTSSVPPTPSHVLEYKDNSSDVNSYAKYRYLDDKPLDSPNDLPPMTPGRSLSDDDRDRRVVYNSPDVRPGSRKRKVSTGSSVSERSSFSQDPTDPTLSPHPSLDEPYLSPQQDATKSFHHSPINGTIKVGFYQDTFPRGSSDKSNSCSPREQLSNCSPRNLSASPRHNSPDYHNYSAPSTPIYQSPTSPAPVYNPPLPIYPGHSASLLQNLPYYDVNKSVTEQYCASIPPVVSKAQPQLRPEVLPAPTTSVPSSDKPISVYPVKKRAYCEVDLDPQPASKPAVEKSSGFTPISSSRDIDRVFTPTPGRMPQSTERAIGLHRYPSELLQSSSYYASDSMYGKNLAPASSVPSITSTSSYPQSDVIITTASYTRNVETTCSSSYSSYNRLSASPYDYPNPADHPITHQTLSEKPVALNYSSQSSSADVLSNKTMPPLNYSNVSTSSAPSKASSSSVNYLDRGNPELLNFSKIHPTSLPTSNDTTAPPDLSNRLENTNRSAPFPTSRAGSYGKVDVNSPQPSRVHYANPITDLSSKINIPSRLGYNQPNPLSYSHPMGDLHYNYPGVMPEMMTGKSPINYPPRATVGYNVDAYKHPMVDLVNTSKASVSEPQPVAKTPKVVPPKKASSRKKKAAAEVESSSMNPLPGNYQQYLAQSTTEPISLKTTSVVPGSAFNFGPAPLKDSYSTYLEDMSRSGYYLPHSDGGSNDEKSSSSSSSTHPTPSYPFLSGTTRPPYPHLTHPPPALYQQYLQRHQQDLLRPMVLHQGLLGPPSSYPPGYIMHDPLNRPPWL